MAVHTRNIILLIVLLCLSLVFVKPSNSETKQRPISEAKYTEIKAAFIYNFTLFVKWRASAFSSEDSRISIAVLGDKAFAKILEMAVKGREVRGRSISIKSHRSIQEIEKSVIIYIGGSYVKDIKIILESVAGSNVLTIGNSPGLAENGVTINFYLENEKVRFEINLAAVRRAGLNISSRVLRLARIVGDEKWEKP